MRTGGKDSWALPGEEDSDRTWAVPATRSAATPGSLSFALAHGKLWMNTQS